MSLKGLVNNKELYDAFIADRKSELAKVHDRMEVAEAVEVIKLQGEARNLRRDLRLRERING